MRPLIIAHRGASAEAPENTLSAFRLAWEQDADAVEMDLRLTRDGHVAVVHDADLRRVAGNPHKVASLTAAELVQIQTTLSPGHRTLQGVHVPMLAEVLREVPPRKKVFLELKAGVGMVGAVQRVLEHGALEPEQVVLIGFDRAAMQVAKQTMPMAEVAWVVDYPSVWNLPHLVHLAKTHGIDGLDLRAEWPLAARDIALLRDMARKVYVWTVDDPARARELVDLAVDGITTNLPGKMRRALAAGVPV